MSAIVGRLLFAAGIAVVSALAYTFFKENNRREQHGHRGRGRTGYDDSDYRSRPSWGGPGDDDEDGYSSRRRHSKVGSRRSGAETKDQESRSKEPTSVQWSCPICLEAFQNLKMNETPIFTTPCGHLFCCKCLKQAITTNHACPSCRVEISFSQCHRIFL